MEQLRRIFFWAVGFFLLGLLLHRVGVETVWTYLWLMGWGYVPVLVISLGWHVSNTWAWGACFDSKESRPGFWTLFWTKLSGEAVGNVTPAAYVGGEVAKAYMLRSKVTVTRGLPSLVVNKTIEVISGLVFALMGAVVVVMEFSLPQEVQIGLGVVLFLGTLGIGLAVLTQRQNTFGWFLNVLGRFRFSFLERHREKFEEIDRNIAAFYRHNRSGFLVSLVLHVWSWVLGVVEVYVILSLLGYPVSFVAAFLLTSLSLVINSAFFFIPSGVGVFEGGHVFLFHLLGLDPGLGLGVGIIRRIRKVFWILMGFLVLLPGALRKRAGEEKEE